MKLVGVVAGAVSLLALAAAMPIGATRAEAAATAAGRTSSITITVVTGSITLSPTSAPAGLVSFKLVNPDSIAHEIDIVRTRLGAKNLPVKPSGQFNERTLQAKVVKEAVKVAPRATRAFSARLTADSYVLVDNLPGHYHAGEATVLTIT